MRFLKLIGGFLIEMPETKSRKRLAFMFCCHDGIAYGGITIGSIDSKDCVIYGFDTERKDGWFYKDNCQWLSQMGS